jgi:hypothetical protein
MSSWNKGLKMEKYPHCGFQKGHKCFNPKGCDGYLKMKGAVLAIERKCENCGKIFMWKPYKKKSKGKFCSRACINFKKEKNPNWQGGTLSPYRIIKNSNQTKWSEWRKSVFERDNWTCMGCGKKNTRLDPHHIKKVRLFPELVFDVSNGITLCRSCHRLVENKKETKDLNGITLMSVNNLYNKIVSMNERLKFIKSKLSEIYL